MIRSFAHKGLRAYFERGSKAGIPPAQARRIRLILGHLQAASSPGEADFPGSQLHPLQGPLKGYWAVSVNGPWRITFRFEEGHAWEVNLAQYH
jgi:proteic killer suppression protein